MSFLNEINNLEAYPEHYSQNYQSGFNWILRKIIFLHSFSALRTYKKEQQQQHPIKKYLKNIKFQDSAEFLSKKLGEAYGQQMRQGSAKLTGDRLISIIANAFFKDQLMVVSLFLLEVALRILLSISIFYLLTSIGKEQYKLSYLYAGLFCLAWFFSQILMMNAYSMGIILSARIKNSLAMLLYSKVSSLSSNAIRSTQIGKITNLLSNDLGTLEAKLPLFLNGFSFPAYSISITLLLVHWFGWAGILGLVIVLLGLPISNAISKHNGEILEEVNKNKDMRVQQISEVIEGIRFIKFYGWQIIFQRLIEKLRNLEVQSLKTLSIGRSFERAIGNVGGLVGGLVVFMVAHYQGKEISVPMIFATLQAILSFKNFMGRLNIGLGFYYEMNVIAQRFSCILNIQCPTLVRLDAVTEADNNGNNVLEKGDIVFDHFYGYWNEELSTPSLSNISICFKKGLLFGIAGKIGSGKSSLLGAILKQIPYYSGQFSLQGTLSYVQQEPILFSATIRNNILFGLPYNQCAYNRAIHESCLQDDLYFLLEGDQTVIGEKGVSISGGQKARLSLARALYADSDIYLLDDPLSAVDAKVAKQIFDRCISKLKINKTVILVTHQIGYLHDCDIVVIMENGKISKKGDPIFLQKQMQEMNCKQSLQSEQANEQFYVFKQEKKQQYTFKHLTSKQTKKLQLKQQSQVTFCLFIKYLLLGKGNNIVLAVSTLLFILTQIIFICFLKLLIKYNDVKQGTDELFQGNFYFFWEVLALLILLYLIFNVIRSYCLENLIINSNEKIHLDMVERILRSPCSYFDKTSVGSLNNKFSNDIGVLDNTLAFVFLEVMEGISSRIVSITSICILYPVFVFMLPIFILIFLSFALLLYFSPVINQCKDIDLQNKNPIYQTFNETINGLTQIRIYNRKKSLFYQFSLAINESIKASINYQNISRGFGISAFILGLTLVLFVIMIGINQIAASSSSNFAAILLLLVAFTENLQYLLRQIIDLQSIFLSYGKVHEIIQLKSERELRNNYDSAIGLKQEIQAEQKNKRSLHTMWPNHPSLEFKGLSARYNPELPLCLNNVSFKASAFSRIGIVGRTGAGKSSIAQTIFRMIQPETGSRYTIDSFNAIEIGLHSLRQHISIIPQTPYLFRGSIRFNVDPFDSASEEKVWQVLEESGLLTYVKSLPLQLDTDISNNSESFSVGQKQLLCLARALLRRNRILVLDEATSNVDMETDSFIQKTIREKFTDTTVITIAHRLSTIADYDAVIVMHQGTILEMGSPHELIQQRGAFYDMVKHTGKSADMIISKAKNSYQQRVALTIGKT